MHQGSSSTTNTTLAGRWPRPPSLLRPLFEQFARPTGLLGRLAGRIMSKSDADDHWLVELLDVQPDDRVLDVGCGPGVTVGLVAERATSGLVCGVDPSTEMLRQAARRNDAAVLAGRVVLRPGEVSALPYPDGHFTKASAIHTLYFWPSIEGGLRELRRVLSPNGLLILAVRMRHDGAGVFEPSRYGLTDEQVGDVIATVGTIGFRDTTSHSRKIGRETITAITARK